jgi:hypothetical protein
VRRGAEGCGERMLAEAGMGGDGDDAGFVIVLLVRYAFPIALLQLLPIVPPLARAKCTNPENDKGGRANRRAEH